jgi:hypothetical protein
MSAGHIPKPRDLDLQAARSADPICVGRRHQIADRRAEVREARARTARLAITRSTSRDLEARGALSLTPRPTITRRATHCHFFCADVSPCFDRFCITSGNGDPIGPKVARRSPDHDPGDPGMSYGKSRTQVARTADPTRDLGDARRDDRHVIRRADHTVPGDHGV